VRTRPLNTCPIQGSCPGKKKIRHRTRSKERLKRPEKFHRKEMLAHLRQAADGLVGDTSRHTIPDQRPPRLKKTKRRTPRHRLAATEVKEASPRCRRCHQTPTGLFEPAAIHIRLGRRRMMQKGGSSRQLGAQEGGGGSQGPIGRGDVPSPTADQGVGCAHRALLSGREGDDKEEEEKEITAASPQK